MIITGLYSRYIGNQTGLLGYNFYVNNPSTSGIFNLGFSGNTDISFSLENGKIYDHKGRFVQDYEANTIVNLSGQINPSNISLYVDTNKVYDSDTRTTGNLKYVYFNSPNNSVDINAFIYGEIPSLQFSTLNSYISGQIITGRITNSISERTFKIFSGEFSQVSNFILSGLSTGEISNQTDFYLVPKEFIPDISLASFNLFTSFGTLNVELNLTGVSSGIYNFYLYLNPAVTNLTNGESQLYTINLWSTSGANIDISLSYISGKTGCLFDSTSILLGKTGQVSGFVSGFDILSKPITGFVSGFDTGVIGTVYSTGFGDSSYNGTYNLIQLGTYQNTGLRYLYYDSYDQLWAFNNIFGVLDSTGIRYLIQTTNTFNPSGQYRIGVASGTSPAGAVYTNTLCEGFNFIPSGVATGTITGSQYATGNLNQQYTLTLTGIGSGVGIVNNVTGAGFVTGGFSGFVLYGGGILTRVFYNFPGTGTIPTNLNQFYGLPSDVIQTISGNISSGVANIVVPFTGVIEQFYTTGEYDIIPLGFDWTVTGTLNSPWLLNGTGYYISNSGITGIVDTNFIFNLRPGTYTFTKYLSGVGIGNVTGRFNPLDCNSSTLSIAAPISGFQSITREIFTVSVSEINKITMPLTGSSTTGYFQVAGISPVAYFPIHPTGAGEPIENSNNLLSGANTRTRISRYITSNSGSGAFSELFVACDYSGYISGTGVDTNFYPTFWTETISGQITTGLCNPSGVRLTTGIGIGKYIKCSGQAIMEFEVFSNQTPININLTNAIQTSGILQLISGESINIYFNTGFLTNTGNISFTLNTGLYAIKYFESGCISTILNSGSGMLFISCINTSTGITYVATGFTPSEYNGTYIPSGTHSGNPLYIKSGSNSPYLYWTLLDNDTWVINSGINDIAEGNILFMCPSEGSIITGQYEIFNCTGSCIAGFVTTGITITSAPNSYFNITTTGHNTGQFLTISGSCYSFSGYSNDTNYSNIIISATGTSCVDCDSSIIKYSCINGNCVQTSTGIYGNINDCVNACYNSTGIMSCVTGEICDNCTGSTPLYLKVNFSGLTACSECITGDDDITCMYFKNLSDMSPLNSQFLVPQIEGDPCSYYAEYSGFPALFQIRRSGTFPTDCIDCTGMSLISVTGQFVTQISIEKLLNTGYRLDAQTYVYRQDINNVDDDIGRTSYFLGTGNSNVCLSGVTLQNSFIDCKVNRLPYSNYIKGGIAEITSITSCSCCIQLGSGGSFIPAYDGVVILYFNDDVWGDNRYAFEVNISGMGSYTVSGNNFNGTAIGTVSGGQVYNYSSSGTIGYCSETTGTPGPRCFANPNGEFWYSFDPTLNAPVTGTNFFVCNNKIAHSLVARILPCSGGAFLL